jgi:translocation and assembly module TamB
VSRRRRRIVLALLLGLIPLAALWLVATESGTRWLVAAAASLSGEVLRVSEVEGTVIGPLGLRGVHVAAGAHRVVIDRLDLQWRPRALLSGRVWIRRLSVQGLGYDGPAPASGTGSEAEPAVPGELPFTLRIDDAEIRDVTVRRGQDVHRIARLRLVAEAGPDAAEIESLDVEGEGLVLAASGRVALASPHAFQARARWRLEGFAGADWAGQAAVTGDRVGASVDALLDSPFDATLGGRASLGGDSPEVDLALRWAGLTWPPGDPAAIQSPAGELTLRGPLDGLELALSARTAGPGLALERVELTARGSIGVQVPHAFDIEAGWRLDTPGLGPGLTELAGAGRFEGEGARIVLDHRLLAPAALATRGTVVLAGEETRVELTGSWVDLRWPAGGPSVDLASAEGSYRVDGTLSELTVELDGALTLPGVASVLPVERVRAAMGGGISARAPHAFQADLDWQAELARDDVLTGVGRAEGDGRRVEFEHQLGGVLELQSRGSVDLAGARPALDLAASWSRLAWPLGSAPDLTSDQGRLSITGDLARLRVVAEGGLGGAAVPLTELTWSVDGELEAAAPFDFDAALRWAGVAPDGERLAGAGRASGDTKALRVEHALEQPFPVRIGGTVALDGPAPVLDLQGDWTGAAWPLVGEARVRSPVGRFAISGPVNTLRADLGAELEGSELPDARLSTDLTLAGDRLTLSRVVVETLGGRVEASGEASAGATPSFRGRLIAEGIEPGRHWPDWPGRVGLEAGVEGTMGAAGPAVRVDLRRLEGRLRERPVAGSGALAYAAGTLEARELVLRSGENRLRLTGEAGDRLDLDFEIQMPALDGLAPGLGGSLSGSGRLAGSRSEPRITADLQARNVAFGTERVGRADLEVRFDPGDPEGSRLVLSAGGVALAGRALESVTARARGGLEGHSLDVGIESDLGTLELAATGRQAGERWEGAVRSLRLDTADAGAWVLRSPVSARAGPAGVEVGLACLEQGRASLCASGGREPDGEIRADGRLSTVPLNLARPWLPANVALKGSLDGEVRFASSGGALSARLALVPGAGTVTVDLADGEPLEIAYGDAQLEATLDGREARVTLGLSLAEAGRLSGDLRLAPFGPGAPAGGPSPALSGRVEARFPDLAVLASVASGIREVQGALEVTADVAGTLDEPRLTGTALLSGGAADLPDLGIRIDDVELTARNLDEDRIAFQGSARSGEGRLDLSGTARLSAAAGWPVSLSVKGERFQFARLPTVEGVLSPDLELAAVAGAISVTGRIEVPALKLDSRVELVLGDAVRFAGFGLTSRLAGRLEVRATAGSLPSGHGALELLDGRYKAYGQDLTIERGRLLFAGPMNNPGVDVRAVRKAGDVTAGISIGGTVRRLDSTVFSEPSLPEAEALAYLLTGRPLSGASGGEAAALSQAALSLGLERSQGLTQAVGLDELSVGGGEGLEQSALLLGKYLTPDLYVRYALGLFDQVGSLVLNYRFSESISVEAESGARQGMDVIYRIERDTLF